MGIRTHLTRGEEAGLTAAREAVTQAQAHMDELRRQGAPADAIIRAEKAAARAAEQLERIEERLTDD